MGCNCVVPICSLFHRSLFSFHRLSFPSTPLTYGIDWKFHTGKCRCPLSGLGAHEGLGQSAAGSPRSVFPPSLTATPVLLSTFASSARGTVLRGLADSCVGLASSPSPVSASDCTPKRARSSRIASNTSSSSHVIAKKIVELRRFQSERFPSTWRGRKARVYFFVGVLFAGGIHRTHHPL